MRRIHSPFQNPLPCQFRLNQQGDVQMFWHGSNQNPIEKAIPVHCPRQYNKKPISKNAVSVRAARTKGASNEHIDFQIDLTYSAKNCCLVPNRTRWRGSHKRERTGTRVPELIVEERVFLSHEPRGQQKF
eukprot:scaffold33574_cov52-Attheya_sp.AAC.1